MAGTTPVLLVRAASGLRAVAPLCPHQNKSLEFARVRGDVLMCPWHGATFGLCDGASHSALTPKALTTYACTEIDGAVTITIA
jgi:nitrite reductase/ring-hydroxylating ferredoxin subunit